MLSVLSLSTGLQESGDASGNTTSIVMDKSGYTRIIAELAEKHRSLSDATRELERASGELELKQTRLGELDRELKSKSSEVGQLQAEVEKRTGSEDKLGKELYFHSRQLENVSKEFEQVRERHQVAMLSLSSVKTELDIARESLTEREKRLRETEERLAEKEKELLRQQTRETLVIRTLSDKELAVEELRKKLEAANEELSYSRGRLSVTEKELSTTRRRLDVTDRRLSDTEQALSVSKVELKNVKQVLGSAVTDLSSTKHKLDKTEDRLEGTSRELSETGKQLVEAHSAIDSTVAELSQTRYKLSEAEKKLQNSILQKYSDSAVKFSINISERKLMMFDSEIDTTLYLPKVQIGRKTYLVTDFFDVFGMARVRRVLRRIETVNYLVTWNLTGTPEAKRLSGTIMSLMSDPRVCLVECPPDSNGGLEIMYYNELKERGLQAIFLIKKNEFGQHITDLSGRCSLDLSGKDKYLYVRNNTKSSMAEFNADIGDVLMSRDGKFIGVVVALDRGQQGAAPLAKCFVFDDGFDISRNNKVPLEKNPENRYYERFAEAVNNIRQLIKDIEKE